MSKPHPPPVTFEIIVDGKPVKLIDSTGVCTLLAIDRGTLTRWIQLGRIEPAGQMPGPNGAYLWDPAYITRLAVERGLAAS